MGGRSTMKVLQLLTSFPPAYAYGGPVASSYNISKNLVKRGHDVSVFTTDVYNSESRLTGYDDPEIRDGIRIRRFKNISNRLAWTANVSTAVGIWPALRTEVGEFDLVHLHEFRSIEAAIASHEAARQDVPIVLQPRGSLPRTSKGFQKEIFDRLFGRRIITSADRIIASSHVESEQYSKVFPAIRHKPLSYVPNGIDPTEYSDLPAEGQFREKHGIAESSDMILYLGRIHERKGIEYLIEAFAMMDSSKCCSLVIVGPDDGYLNQLRQLRDDLNQENILFTGPKYEEEKLAAYVDADVFVLPSKNEYESFGNVVIEAMACGTPVVVTNVCGVSEWLDGYTEGVPPTSQAIRQEIENILNSSQSTSSLQQFIHKEFSWESVAAKTEDIYNTILHTQ